MRSAGDWRGLDGQGTDPLSAAVERRRRRAIAEQG